MESNTSTKQTELDNHIFLNGKQLAEVLGVAAPTITEAVKNGWNCGGFPIGEWAIETETGRIKGYEVPEFLVSGERTEENRPNPSLISANKEKRGSESDTNSYKKYYSLLPEGEDYVRPISMISISSVIKKALESDTPQSRAIIAGGLTALGAIIGHSVTEKASGAGIGAGAGLAISILSYKYSKPSMNQQLQSFDVNQFVKQKTNAINGKALNMSRFMLN